MTRNPTNTIAMAPRERNDTALYGMTMAVRYEIATARTASSRNTAPANATPVEVIIVAVVIVIIGVLMLWLMMVKSLLLLKLLFFTENNNDKAQINTMDKMDTMNEQTM
jgi:hypothetical protein